MISCLKRCGMRRPARRERSSPVARIDSGRGCAAIAVVLCPPSRFSGGRRRTSLISRPPYGICPTRVGVPCSSSATAPWKNRRDPPGYLDRSPTTRHEAVIRTPPTNPRDDGGATKAKSRSRIRSASCPASHAFRGETARNIGEYTPLTEPANKTRIRRKWLLKMYLRWRSGFTC